MADTGEPFRLMARQIQALGDAMAANMRPTFLALTGTCEQANQQLAALGETFQFGDEARHRPDDPPW